MKGRCLIETTHLGFDRNFDYCASQSCTENDKFLEMERQVSVGSDRPVEEDYSWRWTSLPGKFPRGQTCFIYLSNEISENFDIRKAPNVN